MHGELTAASRKRVIVLVQEYPQLSETYIKNEVEQLALMHDIEIVALKAGNYPYRNRFPHILLTKGNESNALAYLRNFSACVVHAHYLHLAGPAARMAAFLKIPYTVRTHSYDILGCTEPQLAAFSPLINQDACRGILTYPYARALLLRAGVQEGKIRDCFPVVDFSRFLDRSPNGHHVMNVGAALPKKQMEDYLMLSRLVQARTFNLYAMGYDAAKLGAISAQLQARVNFINPVEPENMPHEYKKHEWLVYTASTEVGTVGWPLAVAEAQASGVGVLVQRVRDDLATYVGDAGFLFNRIEEAAEIIEAPFPQAMRERGFELARRSDIRTHITTLTDLW